MSERQHVKGHSEHTYECPYCHKHMIGYADEINFCSACGWGGNCQRCQKEVMHLRVTNHAKKRSKERSGVTKGQIDDIAKRAFHEGITHKQARNELSRWMDAEFLKYKTANGCRLYANHLYIFHNQTLITILDADPKYEKDLENYVDSFKTFVK